MEKEDAVEEFRKIESNDGEKGWDKAMLVAFVVPLLVLVFLPQARFLFDIPPDPWVGIFSPSIITFSILIILDYGNKKAFVAGIFSLIFFLIMFLITLDSGIGSMAMG